MNGYKYFYSAVMPELARHYQINEYDFENNPSYNSVIAARSHFYTLALIEIYLEEHRYNNCHSVIGLDGIKALHHLVFLKTNWRPDEIKNLSQSDLLFVLLDDLVPEKLSEPAQKFLKTISKGSRLLKVDLTSYAGWKIGSGAQYLKYDQ